MKQSIATNRAKGAAGMALGGVWFALMGIAVHATSGLCSWELAAFSRASIGLVFAIVLTQIHKPIPMQILTSVVTWSHWLLWLRSLFGIVAVVCLFYSLQNLPVAMTMTLINTYPIWFVLVAAIFSRQRISVAGYLGVVSAVVGVVLVYGPSSTGNVFFACSIALAQGLFTALSMLVLQRLGNTDPRIVVIHYSTCATIVTAVLLLAGGLGGGIVLSSKAWPLAGLLVAAGVCGSLGQLSRTYALGIAGDGIVVIAGLVQVVFGFVADIGFWDRAFSRAEIFGMLLILIPSLVLMSGLFLKSQRDESGKNEFESVSESFLYLDLSRRILRRAVQFAGWGIWVLIYRSKRSFPTVISVCFLLGGGAMIYWSDEIEAYGLLEASILENIGAGLIGGTLLTVGFQVAVKKERLVHGIDYFKLASDISLAQSEIRILTTFSYLFSQDQDVDQAVSLPELQNCRKQLLKVVSNVDSSVSVRVLVLDPLSEGARQRSLDRPDVDVIRILWDNVAILEAWKQLYAGGQFDVRVYSSLPRLSLISVDDSASISFFERNKSISVSRRSVLSYQTPAGQFVRASFDDLWSDQNTLTISDYVKQQFSEMPDDSRTIIEGDAKDFLQ